MLGYVSCFRLHGAPRPGPACSAIQTASSFEHDTDGTRGTDDNQSVLLLILEAKEYSTTFVVLVLL